jgi:hemin uptake protein HemP
MTKPTSQPTTATISANHIVEGISHRVLSSSVLFSGQREVRITHAGVEYTLRITKENKLILTK